MVKLADIPEYERNHLMSKLLPPLGELPWVVNDKPLSEKKVAIIGGTWYVCFVCVCVCVRLIIITREKEKKHSHNTHSNSKKKITGTVER